MGQQSVEQGKHWSSLKRLKYNHKHIKVKVVQNKKEKSSRSTGCAYNLIILAWSLWESESKICLCCFIVSWYLTSECGEYSDRCALICILSTLQLPLTFWQNLKLNWTNWKQSSDVNQRSVRKTLPFVESPPFRHWIDLSWMVMRRQGWPCRTAQIGVKLREFGENDNLIIW